MTVNLMIISSIFLAMGLLIGFFARRFMNITVFVLLIYVAMYTLDALGMTTSWPLFNELYGNLVGTGKTTIRLFTDLLDGAPVLASGLFLMGGVVGLLTKQR